MDNNEAREMDYADTATGPDHELYQCEAECDLAAHQDESLWTLIRRAAVESQNPNRPTPDNYCAQCGDVNKHNDFGRCWTAALPMKLHLAEQRDRIERIAALTDAQRRTALFWMAGGSHDHTEFNEAMDYAESPEAQQR
jgi:hypothetical protein